MRGKGYPNTRQVTVLAERRSLRRHAGHCLGCGRLIQAFGSAAWSKTSRSPCPFCGRKDWSPVTIYEISQICAWPTCHRLTEPGRALCRSCMDAIHQVVREYLQITPKARQMDMATLEYATENALCE